MEDLVPIDKFDEYLDIGVAMSMSYVPKLALALLTLVVGLWLVNRVTAGIERGLDRGGMEATLRKFVQTLVNVGMKALLLISVAGMVGIETTSFIAVLGAASLAVGLALQGSLANFAGGVLILLFRPFKVGDFIDASGQSGTVQEIGIFHTTLTTPDNKTVIIPNGGLSNHAITNFSTQATRRVDVVFGISYDDDLRIAKNILRGVIEADERILDEPAPLVVISSLGDSSVNITTRSWVLSADYWAVYFDLTEKAKLALDEANITIPYPQTDVHLYQKDA